jgi:hypothetical protein
MDCVQRVPLRRVIRFALGLAKSLQWQNSFCMQKEVSRGDPARHFHVPVRAGTPTQYQMESSLLVDFQCQSGMLACGRFMGQR